ncbi:pentapeptide repeat-containing protein [Anaerovibrio sp.]|uniref:pentapeptide repeat-containing protein n=1 Tax=Anaerovibrio sp. TaxID=1872532 RepID=UPI002602E21C|nr:pentapeptide repeat-containing protein [Anaerovibrio sp.]MDD6598358.1 pentapeptide repeat-containing protein [Anaerovibrio sp.]
MEQEKLNEIIADHNKWLKNEGGKRANLAGADLYGVDLRGAKLDRTNLRWANLRRAGLEGVNLRGADLEGADLYGANLEGAKLEGVNLCMADLEGAELPIGVYQIVGPGSCNRCTTYDVINDQIVCGCWNDGKGNHLDSFIKRIEEVYGPKGENPDSIHYAEYMSAVAFFRAMKDLNKKS